MNMLNRQRIAPRVVILEALGRKYRSEALSSTELKAALSALKLAGIDPVRLMDDSARLALTELLKEI